MSTSTAMSGATPVERVPSGIKIEPGMSAGAPDDELQVACQVGLEYV
jgi:hypothetical protein